LDDPAANAALELVRIVRGCDELDDPRWRSLSIIFSLTGKGRNFGNSGYAYGKGADWWAFALPVETVRPPLLTWLHTQAHDLPDSLIRVLMQHSRRTGETRLKAERADVKRWAITPENARQMVDILRPQFEPQ
jgi:hypothetical protein